VLCRADRKPDGNKGDYEIATGQEFVSCWRAKNHALEAISSSREPVVVLVVEP
jgi:hypothetical protein